MVAIVVSSTATSFVGFVVVVVVVVCTGADVGIRIEASLQCTHARTLDTQAHKIKTANLSGASLWTRARARVSPNQFHSNSTTPERLLRVDVGRVYVFARACVCRYVREHCETTSGIPNRAATVQKRVQTQPTAHKNTLEKKKRNRIAYICAAPRAFISYIVVVGDVDFSAARVTHALTHLSHA